MKRSERFWLWLAHHLPHGLVYWCAIRLGAHATCGQYGNQVVPELTFMDALKRWEDGHSGDPRMGPATRERDHLDPPRDD